MGCWCVRRVPYGVVLRVSVAVGMLVALILVVRPPYLYPLPQLDPIDTNTALKWRYDLPLDRGAPQWQRVDPLGQALAYAAHYDDVEWPPIIRVIAVAEDPLPFFFVTCRYYVHPDGPVVLNVTGSLLHLRDRNGRRYLCSYIECPLTHALRPLALSLDKGNQDNALNFMHVRYSHLATWPDTLRFVPPASASPSPSSSLLDGKYRQEPQNDAMDDEEDSEEEDTFEEEHEDASEEARKQRRRAQGLDENDETFLWNVTRCFPAFQLGFDDHVMLAEMMAMSRLLGVQHFVFYLQRAGPRVRRMLKVLESQGDVEVHPWNLNLPEAMLYYAGQLASINDCLYRHLWTSRYLLFGDVDELFVQRNHASLTDLLHEQFSWHEECGAFLFLNVFFNLRLPVSPLPKVNGTQTQQMERLKMLSHTWRHIQVLAPGDRSKPAVDPRKVKTASVHVIQTLRHSFEACEMRSDRGLLHHYRVYQLPPEEEWMDDPLLWDLFQEFLEEVTYILDEYDEAAKSQ